MKLRIFLLFFSNLLLFLSIINADIIDSTCKNTPNPQLCSSILRKSPQSKSKDTRGLALILSGALKSRVELSLKRIDALKKKSKSAESMRDQLQECGEIYKIVLQVEIPEIFEGLNKGNPKFAEDGVVGVTQGAQECEESFKKGSKNPVSASNKSVTDLAGVTRAIVRMLL
ncbi:hypothetical protein Leryth_017319 [Lithospermum erythrorhizon]|nr:hypothetical protein Leryth_017319 [Lithospermum erythrorhizon]